MPVKISVDTSAASSTEVSSFNATWASQLNSLAQAATTQGFDFAYRSAANALITQADVYKETMAIIRYYGGVRYIFLPFFLTAMGVLANQYFKSDNPIPHYFLWAVGVGLSFIMLIFEISLTNNLRLLWGQVEKMIGGQSVFGASSQVDPLPHRKHKKYLGFLRFLLCVPYVAGLGFWGWIGYAA